MACLSPMTSQVGALKREGTNRHPGRKNGRLPAPWRNKSSFLIVPELL